MPNDITPLALAIRDYALALPGAWEDHPWGETVVKVNKKVFIFMGEPGPDGFGMSVKLPTSFAEALEEPGASPTGYGLGRAGWVSLRLKVGAHAPQSKLLAWVEESYRAIAQKRQINELDARTGLLSR